MVFALLLWKLSWWAHSQAIHIFPAHKPLDYKVLLYIWRSAGHLITNFASLCTKSYYLPGCQVLQIVFALHISMIQSGKWRCRPVTARCVHNIVTASSYSSRPNSCTSITSTLLNVNPEHLLASQHRTELMIVEVALPLIVCHTSNPWKCAWVPPGLQSNLCLWSINFSTSEWGLVKTMINKRWWSPLIWWSHRGL